MENLIEPNIEPLYPSTFYLVIDAKDTQKGIDDMGRVGINPTPEQIDEWKKNDTFKNEHTLYYYHGKLWEVSEGVSKLANGPDNKNEPTTKYLSLLNISFTLQERDNQEFVKNKSGKHSGSLQAIPEHLRTENVCITAVKADIYNLRHIPGKHLTEKLITTAIEKDGMSVELINKNRLTDTHYLKALETYGEAIHHFPPHLLTKENCKKAIDQNGWALEFIPDQFKTGELCKKAFNSTMYKAYENYELLKYIPPHLEGIILDYAKFFSQYTHDPSTTFGIIREDALSENIVKEALKMDGATFKIFPERFQHKDNAILAVQTSGLKCIKPDLWDNDLITAHINGGNALLTLNQKGIVEKLTPEHYLLIDKSRPGALIYEGNEATIDQIVKYGGRLKIPEHILKGNNVFSLHWQLKEKYSLNLSYNDSIRVYNGDIMKIAKLETTDSIYKNVEIRFNKEDNLIHIKSENTIKKKYSNQFKTTETTSKKAKI